MYNMNMNTYMCCCSITKSCLTLCNSMNCSMPGLPVHYQLKAYSYSCPSSRWCHPTISSSVVSFSSWPQSFPASRSFRMNQLFASGDQSTGVSASTSVLSMNIQDWSPLGWTGWIFMQSKGLSRVFSSTTIWKHQFFRWYRNLVNPREKIVEWEEWDKSLKSP